MAKKPRKYSRPLKVQELKVNSDTVVRAMDIYVNRTMNALYALDVSLFFLADEEVASKANEHINARIMNQIKKVDGRIRKLQESVDELSVEAPRYTEEYKAEYKIYSPLGWVFLKLIRMADAESKLTDSLWLEGEITSLERTESIRNLRRTLSLVSRDINIAANNALKLVRNNNESEGVNETLETMGVDSLEVETPIDVQAEVESSEPLPA